MARAFTTSKPLTQVRARTAVAASAAQPERRGLLFTGLTAAATVLTDSLSHADSARAADYVNMEAIKGRDYGKAPMTYPDYEQLPSGLQFKDLREGTGATPKEGDTVVIDWDGYTVGYYGRVFEARNKPKGSSFEGNDRDFLRLTLGEAKIIPGVEEALRGMKVGGIRRVIIPEQLGYPNGEFTSWQPSPTTFAGKRTLDFVLKNKGMVDKTLLIDIDLIRIQ